MSVPPRPLLPAVPGVERVLPAGPAADQRKRKYVTTAYESCRLHKLKLTTSFTRKTHVRDKS